MTAAVLWPEDLDEREVREVARRKRVKKRSGFVLRLNRWLHRHGPKTSY